MLKLFWWFVFPVHLVRFWPAVLSAVGILGSGAMGQSGAHKANRTNLAIWREQRDWMTDMSNTEMQRRMRDLEAAGLNPALSMTSGGASTPSTGMPTMVNEAAPMASAAAQAATVAVTAAQARKTLAEAKILESEVPWSAQNAQQRSEKLFSDAKAAAHSVGIAEVEKAIKNEDLDRLQPLRVELQKALVKAEQLGLSEKEAVAELYRSFSELKGFERVLPMILAIIRGAR